MPADLQQTYDALRALMLRAAPDMRVARDEDGALTLYASWTDPKKPRDPVWFGTVTRKSYVAYHLMPLYGDPSLGEELSPELSKRKQGKTCFNFKSPDPVLFSELEALTQRCARAYAERPASA